MVFSIIFQNSKIRSFAVGLPGESQWLITLADMCGSLTKCFKHGYRSSLTFFIFLETRNFRENHYFFAQMCTKPSWRPNIDQWSQGGAFCMTGKLPYAYKAVCRLLGHCFWRLRRISHVRLKYMKFACEVNPVWAPVKHHQVVCIA